MNYPRVLERKHHTKRRNFIANQGGAQDAEIIHAPALDFSKYTTWAAGIGTLGTAIIALVQSFSGVNPAIVDGALAVVAVGLLAIAFVTATDVASRAYATAAQIKSSPPATSPPATSPSVVSPPKANGASTLAIIGAPFSVQAQGRGNEPFRALAIRYDSDANSTIYLVARQNERPIWVKEDEVSVVFAP